ncbi:hypothetical protein [Bacillus sp. AG4(2022)]|uniref:hypothetical protein n=1 Tax=Bacillus sp. AG4(2022) TaxID=2962594 RepID=UPI0028825834|nr:hypothetical protein [Bacillus sp. AG4(2022)]MDT0160338.1 hypothetical protein [Bacillus sp. AG4(2022)]
MLTKDEFKILQFLGSAVNSGKEVTLTPDRQAAINKAIENNKEEPFEDSTTMVNDEGERRKALKGTIAHQSYLEQGFREVRNLR